uniref:BZIP domain-containing protein n=1 Tax=Globisporangium ultimum (strain ATCC 200006 / CBS 805.95 / DAOM BR144) TaxID=431595 RepID=K3W5X6_GLOUD
MSGRQQEPQECVDEAAASELLLSVASQFLGGEKAKQSAKALPADDVFPSFQALVYAATSVDHCDASVWKHDVVAAKTPKETRSVAESKTKLQTRRERNRISCRKTRIKRKMEQSGRKLVVRKRAERNAYLSKILDELPQTQQIQSSYRVTERDTLARQFVAQSLHYQLIDEEYDASWCWKSPVASHASSSSRRVKASCASSDQYTKPQDELIEQWRAIVADYEIVDVEIVRIREQSQEERAAEPKSTSSDSIITVKCEWRFVGVPTRSRQSIQNESNSVIGETTLRFRGLGVEAATMCVIAVTATASSSKDVTVRV